MSAANDSRVALGIDVGGTFTDLVLVNYQTGKQWNNKLLTTPVDPSAGILQGCRQVLDDSGMGFGDVDRVIHGTTLITNALIERKGAVTGLLTTRGFEDLLDIRRESRWDMYNLTVPLPPGLVDRGLRIGVKERTLADGTSWIDADDLEEAVGALLEKEPEAIAVGFLHSYLNPTNELRALEVLTRCAPELPVTLSSGVLPEVREYERLSTAVANAYVQVVAQNYIEALEAKLSRAGFKGALYLMLSHGGLGDIDIGTKYPVRLIESGPAGGCMAGTYYSKTTGLKDLIVFDMGGTTAKASLIEGGRPSLVMETEYAREDRFKKGSGLPLKVASVDLLEIGAGGGSIARLDRLGRIKVGPDSSGADPGPACYDLGGMLPTVTDADLVLGYVGAENFLGGEMPLDPRRAEEAIRTHVAEPLGLDVTEAAWGIHRIVNENMATAAKLHVLEKARDPQRFSLVCLGGAGPVHACRVALAIRAGSVLAPVGAGVKSAMGFLVAPVSFDFVHYDIASIDSISAESALAIFQDLEAKARDVLMRGGVSPQDVSFRRAMDLRYVGQGREIEVEYPRARGASILGDLIRRCFLEEYARLFGRSEDTIPIEVVNWRIYASGPAPPILETLDDDRSETAVIPLAEIAETMRPVFFPEFGRFRQCPVVARRDLPARVRFAGPAIVEERESTLVVLPGLDAETDHDGNIKLSLSSVSLIPSHVADAKT